MSAAPGEAGKLPAMNPASPRILSVIPPMTQLNTPYPSTAYITGFLRSRGVDAVQADLALALDYATVASRVTALVQSEPVELVETMAERVAALILQQFPVPKVRVRVTKPTAVVTARGVGVEIVREA